jgi:tellurite resistance protein TehA-like permease
MVFPLGMYTVCTIQLSRAIGFGPLLVIPRYFIYLAPAAWLAAFAGLLHALLSGWGRR